MTDTFTLTQRRFSPAIPLLGRHVLHDSRSLRFPVKAEPLDSLLSIRHARFIPTLDQNKKKLGSCTGNAGVACLGAGQFWPTVKDLGILSTTDADADEELAIDVYSAASALDPFPGNYPPTDTGSDGLSVAKVLLQRGYISGYQHATSLEAALTALSKQPVIVGTEFLYDMFTPEPDGRLRISGNLAGGHEYLLDELDVANKRVWMGNSWGDGWGQKGRAYLTWEDFGKLLANQGDCTVFVPRNLPAPTPEPVPPAPAPQPDPKAEFMKAAADFDVALHQFLGSAG